jgi:hypothetical protein
MQGAGRAAWPFPANVRQRGSAPASAARMFRLFMDSPLCKKMLNCRHPGSTKTDNPPPWIQGFGLNIVFGRTFIGSPNNGFDRFSDFKQDTSCINRSR